MSGQSLKAEGLARVTYSNHEFIALMRKKALTYARRYGQVDANYLRKFARERGIEPRSPNAWGGIFRGPEFTQVGWTAAKTPSCHGRDIKVWLL